MGISVAGDKVAVGLVGIRVADNSMYCNMMAFEIRCGSIAESTAFQLCCLLVLFENINTVFPLVAANLRAMNSHGKTQGGSLGEAAGKIKIGFHI